MEHLQIIVQIGAGVSVGSSGSGVGHDMMQPSKNRTNNIKKQKIRSNFFYDPSPTLARHQLRRDFPETGDCTYVGQECMLISRREHGRASSHFRVVLVFRSPEDRWAHWAWPLYPMITDMFYKAMIRFLNRPEVKDACN